MKKTRNTKYTTLTIVALLFLPACTGQDTAKFTANAAVYTAMIATGNAGDWNMNADFAGQAAEGFMDLAIDYANGTCSD